MKGEKAVKIANGRLLCAIACVTILIVLLTTAGWATVYYVSTTGTDPATHVPGVDGTKENPWKSLNYGDSQRILLPGDKVIVAAGHYYAPNTANGWTIGYCSGTKENPITYIAQGKVILDGSIQEGGVPRTANGTVVLIGHATAGSDHSGRADYIVFDGFEIIGSTRCLDVKQWNNVTYAETGVIVRNCIFRDSRNATGGAGGVMLTANGIHDCQFYNNIFAVTDESLIGVTRAFASQNNATKNKFFNNTIYIKGPATTVSPQALNGGIFFTDLNKTCVGILDWTKLEWGVNDATGDWTQYAWNVCKTPDDEPAPGDPEGTEYRNILKNNIVWVRNPVSHGVWNTCNPVVLPPGGIASKGHDPGLVHSHNAFSPAAVGGAGGLRFIADYLAAAPPALEPNCPFPEDAHLHDHIFRPTEFETNDIQFENVAAVDFRLKPSIPGVYTNPAIDAGEDVGLPYYGSAPDLGAVESLPSSAYVATGVADAVEQESGTIIDLPRAIVTVGNGVLKNYIIYVEDASRAKAIAVQSSQLLTQVSEGQVVRITGKLDKTGVQPVLKATTISLVGGSDGAFAQDTPLAPVATTSKSIAGVGLDATALLFKFYGKVTPVNDEYFCIDDGSGATDGMGNAGVPVLINEQLTPLTPPTGNQATVTGVVAKKDLGGGVVSVIIPRSQDDITE